MDSSHPVRRAPWWQTLLAFSNAAALAGYVTLLCTRRYGRAIGVLIAGTLIDITANALYVSRDGLHRFSSAFRDLEFLTLYLGLVAVRVIMLTGTLLLYRRGKPHS